MSVIMSYYVSKLNINKTGTLCVIELVLLVLLCVRYLYGYCVMGKSSALCTLFIWDTVSCNM